MKPDVIEGAVTFRAIRIRELQVWSRLGWPEFERKRPQEVRISIELRFDKPLSAEHSDDLAGTVDYGGLSQEIKALCEGREFRLVEKLGADCLSLVRTRAPSARVAVLVRKMKPPVDGLLDGVTFACGDFQIQ